jgi:hypothetical protein
METLKAKFFVVYVLPAKFHDHLESLIYRSLKKNEYRKRLKLDSSDFNCLGFNDSRDTLVYVVCLKSSVNGTRKQTKQKIQIN